jgi:hypothetical protein
MYLQTSGGGSSSAAGLETERPVDGGETAILFEMIYLLVSISRSSLGVLNAKVSRCERKFIEELEFLRASFRASSAALGSPVGPRPPRWHGIQAHRVRPAPLAEDQRPAPGRPRPGRSNLRQRQAGRAAWRSVTRSQQPVTMVVEEDAAQAD